MVNYGWRGSRPLRSGQHRAYRPTLLPDRFARLPLAPGRIAKLKKMVAMRWDNEASEPF
jgi:hypothetical protein